MRKTKHTYRRILACLLILFPFFSIAQEIKINSPVYAGKEYQFALNKGIVRDVVQHGTISSEGQVVLNLPEKDKDYVGMGSLSVDDALVSHFIINHENFELEIDSLQKSHFKGSPENTSLYSFLQREVTASQVDTSLYASSFIDLLVYMRDLGKARQNLLGLKELLDVKVYALTQLDYEVLYTSSLWYNIIDGLIKLESEEATIGNNMVDILKRIKSQEVFEHLTENLITITNQYGWDEAFDIIIPYVQESGRIKIPQGDIYAAFEMAKIKSGFVAPSIEGLDIPLGTTSDKKTLLVFYNSDCHNCQVQIDKLIEKYPELKAQGLRVISISSDEDRQSDEKYRKKFPWADTDKLCDLKGFAGPNYMKYGIMGTPTFFLLDKDAKIIKRYALFSDIDFSSEI